MHWPGHTILADVVGYMFWPNYMVLKDVIWLYYVELM